MRRKAFGVCLLAAVVLCASLDASAQTAPKITSFPVSGGQRRALICKPQGSGPFPTVVFNHASIVDSLGWPEAGRRGFQLDGFCEALAKEGYFTFAPIRELSGQGRGFMDYREEYLGIVSRALDHVLELPEVDRSRVALMGVSMGGLVSLGVSIERADLKALVLLAPAWGRGQMKEFVARIDGLAAPVLLLVEASDSPPILGGVKLLEESLRNRGKELRLVRYTRGGGHELFYAVDYWWEDVRSFLREKLAASTPR